MPFQGYLCLQPCFPLDAASSGRLCIPLRYPDGSSDGPPDLGPTPLPRDADSDPAACHCALSLEVPALQVSSAAVVGAMYFHQHGGRTSVSGTHDLLTCWAGHGSPRRGALTGNTGHRSSGLMLCRVWVALPLEVGARDIRLDVFA